MGQCLSFVTAFKPTLHGALAILRRCFEFDTVDSADGCGSRATPVLQSTAFAKRYTLTTALSTCHNLLYHRPGNVSYHISFGLYLFRVCLIFESRRVRDKFKYLANSRSWNRPASISEHGEAPHSPRTFLRSTLTILTILTHDAITCELSNRNPTKMLHILTS